MLVGPLVQGQTPARLKPRHSEAAQQAESGHRYPALGASNMHACFLCNEKATTPATHRRPVSISRLASSRLMSRNVRVEVSARSIAASSSCARACRLGRAFVTVGIPLKKEGNAFKVVSTVFFADARTRALPRRPRAPACQQRCARRLQRGPGRSMIAEEIIARSTSRVKTGWRLATLSKARVVRA